ncbi:resistin-like [Polypterus senegalus]|uniref:resistin-like n=1 Tax=Polypterus senegalus TaxID=55291 RepID=UPI001963E3D0|nr:resistin-like [Polypterus senegalus]
MKSTALLLLLVALWCSSSSQQCNVDDLIKLGGNVLLKALASSVSDKAGLQCTNVKATGSYANCPSDLTPMSCACGNACGSWDIQNEQTCHCQCANQDWSSARCCKIGTN